MAFSFLFLLLAKNNQPEGSDDFRQERKGMIETQIKARGIKDQRVLDALEKVKRHLFVSENNQRLAYEDHPLGIGEGQTISQPYIVALMTELLELKGGERILEIGTGCGYQAAVLGELAKEVYSIEILESLAQSAEARLKKLGYRNIFVRQGDGFLGWKEHAPYDGIIVTCAPPEIPSALIEQLAEGGRLVIPVGNFFQQLKVVRKINGEMIEEDVIPVRFVPMIHGKE